MAFYEEEEIDLGHLIREQFYLAMPMKPLCRPDCQGLCPQCGVNRNTTECACECALGGPAAGRAAAAGRRRAAGQGLRTTNHAESKTTSLEDTHGQAPHPRRAEAGGHRGVPPVPRAQASPRGLPDLRLLPRAPGARGRRGVAAATRASTSASCRSCRPRRPGPCSGQSRCRCRRGSRRSVWSRGLCRCIVRRSRRAMRRPRGLRAGACDHDDRIRLSRPGFPEGRHGPGARRDVAGLPRHVRRGRRGARRAAVHALLRGTGRPAACSPRTRSRPS